MKPFEFVDIYFYSEKDEDWLNLLFISPDGKNMLYFDGCSCMEKHMEDDVVKRLNRLDYNASKQTLSLLEIRQIDFDVTFFVLSNGDIFQISVMPVGDRFPQFLGIYRKSDTSQYVDALNRLNYGEIVEIG